MPWKIATFGFIAVTSLLAGCSTTSDSSADTSRSASAATSAAGDGRCDASGAQAAVGRQASIDLLNQVRSQSGAQDARILGPNDMVTLEYRSDRVNVNTDATGKVIRVNCG